MKLKTFISCFVVFLIAIYNIYAQAPGCPSVNAGNDIYLDCPQPVQLTATALHTGQTNTYTVSSIPYAPPYPFNTGTPILVNQDDVWSSIINLPFNFCFFDNVYNQIVAGSNGVVSFNTSYAGGYCEWSFSASIPSPSLFTNTIFGPYHDIDPAVSGTMYYAILGSYPCRTFVVNWHNVAMYSSSCNHLKATHQIVIYESTNVIEVYIENAPLCSSWNSGNKVIGIQNATGTVGFTPPGRNTGAWQTSNEAWRFTPNGPQNYTIQWFQGPNLIATNSTVQVTPASTTTYTAVCTYNNCDGSQITVTDDVTVYITTQFSVNPTHDTICQGDSTIITASGGATYTWTPQAYLTQINNSTVVVYPPTSTTYTVYITNQANTCTGTIHIPITVNPPPNVQVASPQPNICEGESTQIIASNASTYIWNDASTENPRTVTPSTTTTYTVTGYDNAGCSNSASITINVSQIPNITFSPPNPQVCLGQSITITASGASLYSWNTGSPNNSITVTPATTTTYQVTGYDNFGLCSSSSSITVTVNPSPLAQYNAQPTQGCQPLTVQFNDNSIGASSWNWQFGDGNSSTQQNPSHTYTQDGTYSTTLIVTNEYNCKDTLIKTNYIDVYYRPIAEFIAVPEIAYTSSPLITFYSSSNAQNWIWNFGDGNSSTSAPPVEHIYPSIENSYIVQLIVYNNFGCADTTERTVYILDNELQFTNVITPNNDGLNDLFVIKNVDKYPNNLLQVFNRWGKKVFEMKNYDNSWDGGNLADGTYYFIFRYLDREFRGTLMILRK